ncbi:MAG: RNA polymerase sigma factor [Planctomycetota bacterium]
MKRQLKIAPETVGLESERASPPELSSQAVARLAPREPAKKGAVEPAEEPGKKSGAEAGAEPAPTEPTPTPTASCVRPESAVESAAETAAVIASQRGDEQAFESLLTKYHGLLYKIAHRKTNDREDTEDICQEIAFHAFRSLPALREPKAFLGWLIALAHNRANRFCRTRQRRGRTLDEARDLERVRAARDQRTLARGEKPGEAPTNEPVRQIVASLPEEYRLALTWKYLEGLTYEVIGERLKMSFHQVDYLLRKAKRALRDAMPAP